MFGFCKNKNTSPVIELKDRKQVVNAWLKRDNGYLHMTYNLPATTAQTVPVVILMHGFMASKSMFPIKQLGKVLSDAGLATVSFDFNGHGKSYGKFKDMTILNEVEDAMAVFNHVKGLDICEKVYMVGHSQGGVVASLCAGQLKEQLAGAVLLAPAAVVYDDMHNGCIMNVKFDPANPPEKLWVMLHPLGREYILTAQKLDIYGEVAKYTGPLCMIHGKKDKIVPYEYSIKYNQVCSQSKLVLLDDETHMFNVNKPRLMNLVLDFINS